MQKLGLAGILWVLLAALQGCGRAVDHVAPCVTSISHC
jgi:hypothetical protein